MPSTWNPAKAYQTFSSNQLNTTTGQSPIIGEAPDNANSSLTIHSGILKTGGVAVSKFGGMAVKIVASPASNANGVDYFTRSGGGSVGGNTFDQALAADDIFGFVYFDRKKPFIPASQLKSTYRMLDVVGFGGRIYLQSYADITAGQKLELVDALDADGNTVTAVQPLDEGKQVGIALSSSVANEPVYTFIKF